jgi:hypothetical protein
VFIDFVHLAGCTSFDIVSYEVFHVGPPIMLLDKLDSFCDSRVASGFGRVKMLEYTPSKIRVFHNDKGVLLS